MNGSLPALVLPDDPFVSAVEFARRKCKRDIPLGDRRRYHPPGGM